VKKILLADDSITIQKVVSITFASEDYDLIIVSDGDAAIEKAKDAVPDLIMADVSMPGKTGYEVCETVKKDPVLGKIPVILLAGTFEPLNAEEASRVGADDHIVKPFESEMLIKKVKTLLERPPEVAAPPEAIEPEPPELIEAEPLEEHPKAEPFKAEPFKIEPFQPEPTEREPFQAEPVSGEGAAKPGEAKPPVPEEAGQWKSPQKGRPSLPESS
jgi:CheY-like chemotaxis protein